MRANSSGFTVIEVMIAVVIVAVLLLIAYPSYEQYIIRANRADAKEFMVNIGSREQEQMHDTHAYTDIIGTGGLGLTPPSRLANRYTFNVALVNGPPPGYTITATAIGAQQSDGNLTFDSSGTKTPADKWNR